MDLSKSHVIFKNQYVRKLVSLKDICRNEFSFIRIILKLTFLFQLFKKFRENIICPMKAKSTISAEIFFRETFSGYSIEIDNCLFFTASQQILEKQLPNRRKFRRAKFFVIFLWQKFLPVREKGNIWKKVTSITKPCDFTRIFIIYKISYDRVL